MKRIIDLIIKYISKNQKKVLLYGITTFIITFSTIFLIYSIDRWENNKNVDTINNKDNSNNTLSPTVTPSDNPMEPSQVPTEGLTNEPTVTPDLSGEDPSEVEAPELTDEIEADAHDPQTQVSTGVELDIKDVDITGNKKETITFGIDVAKWQGVIEWEKVKDADIEFAMIRVGYRTLDNGIIVEDPYAKYNLQEASKHGIQIGVYFFSTALNTKEAKEEAAWVADFIAPYPITYPVAYNCEGFTDPNNRQYGMSNEARTDGAIAFLDYIKNQGYTPMFYASKNEMEGNAKWNADILSNRYKIWLAQYPDKFDNMKSSYTGKHDMWQYTSKGNVPGIDKMVDLNVAYFDYDKTAKPKDTTPVEEVSADPTALINFKEVDEKVTAKIETNLRSVPSTEGKDTVVTVLKNGDTAIRTGIANNGWSRVEYQGQTLYAVSSYLTTDLDYNVPTSTPIPEGPKYQKVNEEITAKDKTNLRSEPNTESDDTIEAVLNYGDIATRTGIGDNGWSKVEYNGKTLYALTNYLTTDLYYRDNTKPTLENPEAGIIFTEVNEKVTAKEVTNLRIVPTTEIEDTVAAELNNGDIAIRTGIGNNGWSRLEYDGKVLYAVTSYLKKVE